MQLFNFTWSRAFFLLLGVLPSVAGLVYSFLYSIGGTGALSTGWTGRYWLNLVEEKAFWISLGLSTLIALAVSLLSGWASIQLVLRWKSQLERPWSAPLLRLPMLFPPIVAAFIGYQWLSNSGLLARVAFLFGWIKEPEAFPALVNSSNQLGIFFTLFTLQLPLFCLFSWHQFKEAKVEHYLEQAAILGASKRQQHWTIAVPILWSRMKPTMLLYGVFLFGAYEIPLVLGQPYPGMLSVFLHNKFSRFDLQEIPVAYAGTLVYALLVFGVTLYFFKTPNRWADE
jgi:putative spermidine/putrescine transport system permease protein